MISKLGTGTFKEIIRRTIIPILLIASVLVNLALINAYVRRSQELNTAWWNGTEEIVTVGVQLTFVYQENQSPDSGSLTAANTDMQMLSQQLNSAVELPYGQKIIPFSTVQTIQSFLNYETSVTKLMQAELKTNGRISDENLKRWQIINNGWHSMFKLMQDELTKSEPSSSFFKEDVWQKIYVDATTALNQVEPLPLPEK